MEITKNAEETRELGRKIAREMKDSRIVCLTGELGSGKTTFTQGFLEELGAEGPYNSPTFVIMKKYHITHSIKQKTKKSKLFHVPCSMFQDIYHIDAYRVNEKDILNLGWEEITANKNNVILVEWADRIKEIIPQGAVWIKFEWLDENKRNIIFK